MMVDTASSRLSGHTQSRVREGQVHANTVQWAEEMHRLPWEHAGGVGLGTSLPDKEQAAHATLPALLGARHWSSSLCAPSHAAEVL